MIALSTHFSNYVHDNKEVEKKTYFLKPDNFEISEESKKIHKITELSSVVTFSAYQFMDIFNVYDSILSLM